jgi:hypothetical protein
MQWLEKRLHAHTNTHGHAHNMHMHLQWLREHLHTGGGDGLQEKDELERLLEAASKVCFHFIVVCAYVCMFVPACINMQFGLPDGYTHMRMRLMNGAYKFSACMCVCVFAYMHLCAHTDMHTYIHARIRASWSQNSGQTS